MEGPLCSDRRKNRQSKLNKETAKRQVGLYVGAQVREPLEDFEIGEGSFKRRRVAPFLLYQSQFFQV
uniref:Uncharacterized protein n=1 Tax=Salix viminalis TaxID=40686 RepID=A0A6N2MQR8_SALVM